MGGTGPGVRKGSMVTAMAMATVTTMYSPIQMSVHEADTLTEGELERRMRADNDLHYAHNRIIILLLFKPSSMLAVSSAKRAALWFLQQHPR